MRRSEAPQPFAGDEHPVRAVARPVIIEPCIAAPPVMGPEAQQRDQRLGAITGEALGSAPPEVGS